MCKYCEDDHTKRVPLEFEYDGCWSLELVKCTPLPAINLTTGEVSDSAEPPYWCLFLKDALEEFKGEQEAYPIKYCPICGRLLPTKGWV